MKNSNILEQCAVWCDAQAKSDWYGKTASDMVRAFAAAIPDAAQAPVAWLHTMHMEGGQTMPQVTLDASNPFGVPGRDYDSAYHVASVPLYAAPVATQAPNPDLDELKRAMCVVGVVGNIDGYDVIRRTSALDIIDQRKMQTRKERA